MPSTQQENPELTLPDFSVSQILEKLILGGIIFILALPLLGDYGLWLFPIGRDIIFKLTVELLWVLFLLKTFLAKPQILNPNDQSSPKSPNLKRMRKFIGHWSLVIGHLKCPIVLSLLAFWLIMLFSTIASVQPAFSFWGNIYKNQGLLTWTHYLLFFFFLTFFLHHKKQWQVLINIVIGVASVVSLIALWQVLQHDFAIRASATLNNSNYLAAYLILLLPVTFACLLTKRSLWFAGASLLQFLALLFTQTRGGYLGIAAAIFVFAFLYLGQQSPRRACGAAGALLISAFLIALLIFTPTGQKIQEKLPNFTDRFLSLQSIKGSAAPRLEAWRAGSQGMLKKPLLGYGPENFFVAYDEHYSGFLDSDVTPIELSPWEAWFDKAHNFIFDIGATTGFLGLFAYIAVFISTIWSLTHTIRSPPLKVRGGAREGVIKAGLIAAFTGYLMQNLLGFDTLVPGIYLMFILGYAYFLTNYNPPQPPLTLRGGRRHYALCPLPPLNVRGGRGELSFRILVALAIIFLAALFVLSIKMHADVLRANHQLNLAEALAHSGQIEQGFAAFEKGLEYNAAPINPNLRRRYAIIALAYYDAIEKKCSAGEFSEEKCTWLTNDSKTKLTRALELQNENAAKEWPRFTRNYIYAAQIAHILERYDESDEYFKRALKLSPGRRAIETKRTLFR